MFEKEAEEYTKKNFCGCCPLIWKNQCKNYVNCVYHDSWKDGAEFGYNKANEWHYVKDELKKEAEENSFRYTLDKPWACEVERKQIMAHFEKGYLAGSESREKRIAELEQELEFEKSVNGEFSAVNKLRELEKENAELKADNEARKFAMSMSEKVEKQLREENAELKARIDNLKDRFEYSENYGKRVQGERHRLVNDNAKLREQLTKAKELLKWWVSHCGNHDLFYAEKTERFIKDSEMKSGIKERDRR